MPIRKTALRQWRLPKRLLCKEDGGLRLSSVYLYEKIKEKYKTIENYKQTLNKMKNIKTVEINKNSKLLNPFEYVKRKNTIECEIKSLNDIVVLMKNKKSLYNTLISLQRKVITCLYKKIEVYDLKKELVNLIYEVRYYNLLPIEKDKKIKDALFKLTHEIKNPLAVCKGYIDMIDLNKEEKALKYINIMKQEINRSLNIISDFVEYNKIKVVKEQIDLNCLLDDVYDSFKILMTNKKIKLEYKNRNDQEIYFNGDYERLKQVIINILKNACEACTENGKIEISSNLYKNYLDILIEDNGIGMDEETLKNIKEMFYTTKQNGTGLGVALSNEIIKSHNGELLFTSELNKGTKVTIRLPY